jgi:putative transposase
MPSFCKHITHRVYGGLADELDEFTGGANHLHLLLAYPRTVTVSAQRLRSRTAYSVRPEFTGACVHVRIHGHLWSPSRFPISHRGAPLSIIEKLIDSLVPPPRGPNRIRRTAESASPAFKPEPCAQESSSHVLPT